MQLLTTKELQDIGQAYLAGVRAAQAGQPYHNPYHSYDTSTSHHTLRLELRYADLDPNQADYCYRQNLRTAYEQGYHHCKLTLV